MDEKNAVRLERAVAEKRDALQKAQEAKRDYWHATRLILEPSSEEKRELKQINNILEAAEKELTSAETALNDYLRPHLEELPGDRPTGELADLVRNVNLLASELIGHGVPLCLVGAESHVRLHHRLREWDPGTQNQIAEAARGLRRWAEISGCPRWDRFDRLPACRGLWRRLGGVITRPEDLLPLA